MQVTVSLRKLAQRLYIYAVWFISLMIGIFPKLLFGTYFKWRRLKKGSVLCIEAGVNGWKIIEYQEMYASAAEYLGTDQVLRLVVLPERCYVVQAVKFVFINKVSHYVYSPRTGSQNVLVGLFEAFVLSLVFAVRGVTPIVFLSDLPVTKWRAQAAVVSALGGVVNTLMVPGKVAHVFPHGRLLGPYLLPLSAETVNKLSVLRRKKNIEDCPQGINPPVFAGALYEPRASHLASLEKKLKQLGLSLEVKGRKLNEARRSDDEYWATLAEADIVVTTADQVSGVHTDFDGEPHFLYRYTEVLAAGALLVAPRLEGIERYFVSGVHYVGFETIEDASKKIEFYMKNPDELYKISAAGNARALEIFNLNLAWHSIDYALGPASFRFRNGL